MRVSLKNYLWSSETAVKATGGKCLLDWHANGVAINSKEVNPGDLFVAIKGPTFNGHDFVADALAAGASAAVIDRRADVFRGDTPLLEVSDTTEALENLGRAARQRAATKIIAVTGSVGKTGTKEALHLVLQKQASCSASWGNLNNHWGVPLSLSRMPANTAFGVFEIGMNHPGEITPLTKMVRPHIAIITNVELVHSEYFESLENIADAKAEIFTGLEDGGVCILNRDDDQYERLYAAALLAGVKNTVSFGVHADAQARAVNILADCDGSDVDAIVGGKKYSYRIGSPGQHWVMNSLAVLTTVDVAGGDVSQAALELARMRGLKGRGRVHSVSIAGGSIVVIDESYNASPASMHAAIKVLGKRLPKGGGRRIAVLGDMLELGSKSAAYHEALAHSLIVEKIDLVFTAGPYMDALYKVLPQPMRGVSASTSQGLLEVVLDEVRPGDAIVVKGSAGTNTGRIVKALLGLGEPNEDDPDNHKRMANG